VVLKLGSIAVRGFGSYGPTQEVLFGGRGPVAVVGDNGSGKSTIVSKALTWCLYGKCPPERMGSGTRALAGKHIVASGCKEAAVSVHLTEVGVTEEDEASGVTPLLSVFRVSRKRKRTGGETIEIVLLGTQDRVVGEDQAAVERLIGASYETFVRTVIRGQNDPWSFAEATDARKREVLDAISGADLLRGPYDRAKAWRGSARMEVTGIVSDIERREAEGERIDPDAMADKLKAWTYDHKAHIEGLQETIEQRREAVADARKADAATADAMRKRKDWLSRKPVAPQSYLDAQDAAAKARAGRVHATTVWNRAQQDADNAAKMAPGQTCGSCGQVIGEEAPTAAVAQRKEAKAKALGADADAATARMKAAEALRDKERATIDAEATAWESEGQYHCSPTVLVTPQAEERFKSAMIRLDDARKLRNPHTEAYEREQQRLHEHERGLAIQGFRLQATQEQETMAHAWEGVLGPKGVRALLAERALASIEIEANRALTALYEGALEIEFSTVKETKSGTREQIETLIWVTDAGGRHVRDLLSFSGGERRRISAAVDFGVSAAFTHGGSLNLSLLVIDEECFSGLDLAGKQAMARLICESEVEDTVVIDHDPQLAAVLPRALFVSRGEDGYSRVKERA